MVRPEENAAGLRPERAPGPLETRPSSPKPRVPPKRPQGRHRSPARGFSEHPRQIRASRPPQSPEASPRPPPPSPERPGTPSPPLPRHRSPGPLALGPSPPFRGPREPRAAGAAATLGRLAAAFGRPCAIAAAGASGPELTGKRRAEHAGIHRGSHPAKAAGINRGMCSAKAAGIYRRTRTPRAPLSLAALAAGVSRRPGRAAAPALGTAVACPARPEIGNSPRHRPRMARRGSGSGGGHRPGAAPNCPRLGWARLVRFG